MPVEPADFLVFLAAALALNLTPGNDMMYVIGQSLSGGVRSGIAASLGIATGSLVHIGLVAAGLAVVLAQHPLAFEAVRYAGITYLLWIAFKTVAQSATALAAAGPAKPLVASWRDGVLVNVLNPKIIVFMFAFLPPFVRPENGSPVIQILFLGMVFNAGGTAINIAVAAAAGGMRQLIARRPKLVSAIAYASAAVFVAIAMRLAFERR